MLTLREKKSRHIKNRTITTKEFDTRFDRGENIVPYLDFEKATVVKRVNVDFPVWMIEKLDQEARKLNVSRQAVIKMWVHDRLLKSVSI